MLITNNYKKGGYPNTRKTLQKTVVIQTVEAEVYDRRLGEVIYQLHNLVKGLQKIEDLYKDNKNMEYINKTILKEKTVTYVMDITEFCQKARIKGE